MNIFARTGLGAPTRLRANVQRQIETAPGAPEQAVQAPVVIASAGA